MGRLRELLRRDRDGTADLEQHRALRRSTFLDPSVDDAFRRDGFAVVDLLDAEGVADLMVRYDAMAHEQGRDSPFAEGFHTTMYDGRVEYRREVLAAIDATIAPALADVLDRHRIFVGNFAVKLPGGSSVPYHVDWSWVDEEAFRSVGVWCALVDTSEDNGALGMVVGSHRAADDLRPVNQREYTPYDPDASDRSERLLPLRAGQAIVYDSRTTHFSAPNGTGRTRVAVACVAAPAEAELVHHWLDADDELVEFRVSREFYLTYVVGTDPSSAAGIIGARHLGSPS